MPVLNSQRWLDDAVQSILHQTFRDFELVVVDDGSTDGSVKKLLEYGAADPRVRVIQNDKTQGISASLNTGLRSCRGEFVARMDADDVAAPERLDVQVKWMDMHGDVGLLGSSSLDIDEKGNALGVRTSPLDDVSIRWRSLLANPFIHPTVMWRAGVLRQSGLSYDETLPAAQDYDLWTRVLKSTKGGNIDKPLVRYRRAGGVTQNRRVEQLRIHDRIAFRTVQERLPECFVTGEQLSRLRSAVVGGSGPAGESCSIAQAELSFLYLRMFKTYLAKYRENPDLESLKKTETAALARRVIRSGLNFGRVRLLVELFRMHPGLWRSLHVGVDIPRAPAFERLSCEYPDDQP